MIKKIIKKQREVLDKEPEPETVKEIVEMIIPEDLKDITDTEFSASGPLKEEEMSRKKPDIAKKCKICREVFVVPRKTTKCPGCGAGKLYAIEE